MTWAYGFKISNVPIETASIMPGHSDLKIRQI